MSCPFAWPTHLALVALVCTFYAAIRGLLNAAHMTFVDGVFCCTHGALGAHNVTTIALADLSKFEGQRPSDYSDVAHVVAHVNGDIQRLPIEVADAAPIRGYELAVAVAVALNDMLVAARHATRDHR